MFDIGWGELFLIGVVALIVVGPKDLPALFRTIGNFTGKARGMAREFQRSLEQAANESGMSEVSKSLRSIDETLNSATESARKFATQPVRQMAQTAGEGVAKPHTPATGAASVAEAPMSGPKDQAASASAVGETAVPGSASPATPAPIPAERVSADPSQAVADESRAARG